VAVDEAHHLGAATFARIVPRFSAAYRICLSATPRRRDGAENVFFYHISPVTYSAHTQSMRPSVRRIYTETMLRPISRGQYKVKADNLNSAQIANQICADTTRTRALVDDIVEAVRNERKVMVVSARLEHLRTMMDQVGRILRNMDLSFVPVLDAYTGQWFTDEVWDTTTRTHRKGAPKLKPRTEADLVAAERANCLFATSQLISEGLDIPALDVLVLTTPIADVEQAVGRVRRWCVPSSECVHYCPWRAGRCTGKPEPIVTDVIDERIPRLRGMAARREKFYKTCCTV
jgi:superfamily II DNA or RNA helicase